MRRTRRGAPALRVRDVLPAFVGIVLLLGVAGCMGAFGGGPLDGDDGRTSAAPTPESSTPSPSFVVSGPEEGSTPEYLNDFAEQLAEAKRSGLAPAEFTNREDLFSCGAFVLGHGATVPQEAWDCLADRVETGAELVEVQPTTEGDPIFSYYRVGPGIDGVEVFHDPTHDKFGSDTWQHRTCPLVGADIRASATGCVWGQLD